MSASTVEIVRSRFATREADVGNEFIGRMYTGRHPRVRGGGRNFACEATSASTGKLRSDYLRYSMTAEVTSEPMTTLTVGTLLGGEVLIETDDFSRTFRRGDSWIDPIGTDYFCRFGPDNLHVVTIDLDDVAGAAAQTADLAPGELRFHGWAPVTPAMNRYWRELSAMTARHLHAPDSAMAHPLLEAHLRAVIAAAALAVFPNTTMTRDHVPGPGAVAPATLRRAVAFIEAHASLPLTVADIAHAARVTPRALQAGFRRHLGTTPMGQLRRIRLQAAHRELQAADPTRGATVAAVALRWGFASAQRFAACYREEFGVLPSHTLRS